MYPENIRRVLISEAEIAAKVHELGAQIAADYAGKELLLVSVLKGSVVFLADLMRALPMPYHIDFMVVSSYGNAQTSSGAVKINLDLKTNIQGKHVLIVEDIIDSGLTLSYLRTLLATRKPASVEVCALLNKPECNRVPINARYVGFDIPHEFAVGYGLDCAEDYRGLPYIGVLEE